VVTATDCTAPNLLFNGPNSVYSCQIISYIVGNSGCAANTANGDIYAYYANDATISGNDYSCQTADFIKLDCATTDNPSDSSAVYKAPTGYY
jgi:hypothetical protein